VRRTIGGLAAALLAAATLGVVTAGPAAAGGCAGTSATAPDGRIRVDGGDWNGGGGNYPFASANAVLGAGQLASYELQWRNMGNDNLTVKVRLNFSDTDDYRVKYFVNGVNVTQTVRDGKALKFPNLAPGTRTAKVNVTMRNLTGITDEKQVILRGFYGGDPNPTTNCDELEAVAND
jgi:hypothetical protein